MSDDPAPESDRAGQAPHPRETAALFGQEAAVAAVDRALASGRMHHGWLLTGPRGTGKATLAWAMARALLTGAPGLTTDPADPVVRRMAALSEPRLLLLRRPWDDKAGRFRAEIPVDEVRRLRGFFALSAADGGRRVVIVDAADDLNPSAANAILKALEEPPAGAVLILISHRPAGLLPTIRSRCRELRLATLGPADLARAMAAAGVEAEDPARLAILSGGSVGAAIRLAEGEGLALYARLTGLFDGARLDRPAALALADRVSARGAEDRLDVFATLVDLFLARLARAGVAGPPEAEAAPGEAALLSRLSPDAAAARAWAERQQELGARLRAGRAVNLDPGALVLDLLLRIEETARLIPAGG